MDHKMPKQLTKRSKLNLSKQRRNTERTEAGKEEQQVSVEACSVQQDTRAGADNIEFNYRA